MSIRSTRPSPEMTLLAAVFFLLGASCGDSSTAATDGGTTTAKLDVPMGKDALLPWLQAKSYASWPKESKSHSSQGDHGADVLVHLHPTLDASLRAGATTHPMGAAMVKEQRAADGTISGWAVAQKTDAASANGANWYWFEVEAPGAAPKADGKGGTSTQTKLCVACHQGGTDFLLTTYPLQ